MVLNTTAVAGGSPGFLTLNPADAPSVPNASSLNFTPGQVIPNMVAVPISAASWVTIQNTSLGATNVIADLAGFFTA